MGSFSRSSAGQHAVRKKTSSGQPTFGSTRAVAPRRPAMAADELHKFDPEKHKHRRVWVAVAATLLALQAALAVV